MHVLFKHRFAGTVYWKRYMYLIFAGLVLIIVYILDVSSLHSVKQDIDDHHSSGGGSIRSSDYTNFTYPSGKFSLIPENITGDIQHNVSSFDIQEHIETQQMSIKTILLWTPYYKFRHFGFHLGESGFRSHNCDVRACTVTENKRELDTADAVVFHGAELPAEIPKHAHSRQVFVFVMYESPQRLQPNKLANLSDIFNLTITYMDFEETDIPTPYGVVVPRSRIAPEALPSEARVALKTRLIAWIVSNCHPRSSRAEYADELRKYVTIDTYGKCGNLSCPKSVASCYSKIIREHLFMLSFENSYCLDYATEKLFRPLALDIVPITLGRANYSAMLPANSYIDVRDFQSPKHLAQYLIYLQNNQTAYREYFAWKDKYVVLPHTYTRPKSFCRLCEILHNSTYVFKRSFDPEFYWQKERHCLDRDREKHEVHLE